MYKIMAVIDGRHLHSIAMANGFQVDYRRFKEAMMARGMLVRGYFLAAVDEAQEFRSYRPLLDWLDYNGYTTIEVDKRDVTEFAENFILTALAAAEGCDEIVLVTGSYPTLMNVLKRKGVRVIAISDVRVAQDAVRRAADTFIDIAEIRSAIERVGR